MRLYTIKQVAALLSISERSVNDLIKSAGLRYIDVSVPSSSRKARKRIREDDLQAFLDSRSTKTCKLYPEKRYCRRKQQQTK